MHVTDCFQLGVIKRPYSFKGELVAKLLVDEGDHYIGADRLFILEGGDLVPYFVNRFTTRPKSEFRLKLEDVDSEKEAKRLSGKGIYLPLSEKQHQDAEHTSWVDYLVVDAQAGELGRISAVLDIPGNPQLEVTQAAHEFLIPLNAQFITEVNDDTQTIHTDLPEGLIDLDD